jgi:hypothetical protein
MSDGAPIVERMWQLVKQWQDEKDERAIFLNCYLLMTRNVLGAIEKVAFRGAHWVHRFLQDLAGYYFRALEAYERVADRTSAVWQITHRASMDRETATWQRLLLRVNPHIDYDLVFSVADLLQPDWTRLANHDRRRRYADHRPASGVIARTVEIAQDEVVEHATLRRADAIFLKRNSASIRQLL